MSNRDDKAMQSDVLPQRQWFDTLLGTFAPPLIIIVCLLPWLAANIGAVIALVICTILAAIICYRPILGVHLTSVFLPVHACKIAYMGLWATPATFGVGAAAFKIADMQEINYALGQLDYWVIFPFQLVALLTVPTFIFCRKRLKNRLACRVDFITRRCNRWMLFLPIAFMVWTIFSLLWVSYPLSAAYSLFRFSTNLVIIFFLISVLTRYELIVQTLAVYFVFAFIHALSAAISTWYPFFYSYIVGLDGLGVGSLLMSLSNTGTSYNFAMLGVSDGYGWSGKHELAMYLITAILTSPVLLRYYRSFTVRFLIICGVIFMVIIIHRGPIKVTILGSLLVVSAFGVLLPKLRNSLVSILLILIVLNCIGLATSQFLRIPIKNKMGMTTGNIENVASSSKFEVGTMAYRIGLWEATISDIVESRGMGAGGDSLLKDQTFFGIHSCSLPLNMINDYGIFGFLFLLLFALIPIKWTWQSIARAEGSKDDLWWLQMCILAAYFTCFLDHAIDLFIWNPQIWFLLGLLWAVYRLAPKQTSSDRSVKELSI